MAKKNETYQQIIVESYRPSATSGLHGPIHIRPLAGQGLDIDLQVECSKELSRNYPVGTRFRIRAKLTVRKWKGNYLYSSHLWPVTVIAKN